MLFNKTTQVAFVLPTRCGSTSVKAFLESAGFSQVRHELLPTHHHVKYSEAVKLYPNLAKYKKYGVFRDPFDRFMSTVNYLLTGKPLISLGEFLEFFEKRSDSHLDIFKTPQVEWLAHEDIQVVKFEELETKVPIIVNHSDKFPHLNSSDDGKNFSDRYYEIMGIDKDKFHKELKGFVEAHYAADYTFSKTVLNIKH